MDNINNWQFCQKLMALLYKCIARDPLKFNIHWSHVINWQSIQCCSRHNGIAPSHRCNWPKNCTALATEKQCATNIMFRPLFHVSVSVSAHPYLDKNGTNWKTLGLFLSSVSVSENSVWKNGSVSHLFYPDDIQTSVGKIRGKNIFTKGFFQL